MSPPRRLALTLPRALAFVAMLAGAGAILVAQIEPGDRGIAPLNSSSSYEVSGVRVDIYAKDADAAHTAGWRMAQRIGWKMLYARTHGVPLAEAPGLSDGTLDGIVAGIVVEDEEISAHRYIARLGVLFDRARTGGLLGVGGEQRHSAPMLVIPVMWSGGTPTSFETRNDWQRAWAKFRGGTSPIDYVRPYGAGVDPLLVNAAQARRPGRAWWRNLLDQYGAADILVPEVRIARRYPGGPVDAWFVARHGPDGDEITRFGLTAPDSDALPAMLDNGVRRIDAAYVAALTDGRLVPDPSLQPPQEDIPVDTTAIDANAEDTALTTAADTAAPVLGTGYTLQIDTPDPASLAQAEAAVRSVPGVRSSSTASIAIGGVSLIRLVFEGEPEALRIALSARGFRAVDAGGGTIRVRRAAAGDMPEQP